MFIKRGFLRTIVNKKATNRVSRFFIMVSVSRWFSNPLYWQFILLNAPLTQLCAFHVLPNLDNSYAEFLALQGG